MEWIATSRESHQRCSLKKIYNFQKKRRVLKSLFKCRSFFLESLFNKVFKKRLQHTCFPVIFVKVLRTTVLKNICEQLLLDIVITLKTSQNINQHYVILLRSQEMLVERQDSCKKLISGEPSVLLDIIEEQRC